MTCNKLMLLAFSSWFCIATAQSTEGPLILTEYIKDGKEANARILSRVDPTNFLGVDSHSGFITVNEQSNSNLFFWFFPVDVEKLEETPWIIWLQGGPGMTSLLGLFDSIGPLKYEDNELKLRDVTWASNYSLLFIDNPVGAGFSFTSNDSGYVDNEDDVGKGLLEFLRQFLQMFPELQRAPLFIAGESYAGKYIPALGIQIHRTRHENLQINLRGLAIGNGLIDPKSMINYSDLCRLLGFLDDHQLATVEEFEHNIIKYIDEDRIIDASNVFNKTIEYIKNETGVNIYNFNEESKIISSSIEEFIQTPQVRRWIHVGNATFNVNNQYVYEKMLPDIMNTTKPWVEELLNFYAVMCYNGQLDLIVPYGLSRNLYNALRWTQREDYAKAPRSKLIDTESKKILGYMKSGGNFVEVLIRRAGHMVSEHQPQAAKYIIDEFIQKYK